MIFKNLITKINYLKKFQTEISLKEYLFFERFKLT